MLDLIGDQIVLDWIAVESFLPINVLAINILPINILPTIVDYFSNIISIIKIEMIDSPGDNRHSHPPLLSRP